MLPLLHERTACMLPVCSRDISLKVNEVEFVQSGFAHREEQQVGGEDQVDSTDLQEPRLLLKLVNGAGLLWSCPFEWQDVTSANI